MNFEKFKQRLQDITIPEDMCKILNDIIDKEIIKDNDNVYLKVLLNQKDNDFTVLQNFLSLFEEEKKGDKLIWETEKKDRQIEFTLMNGIIPQKNNLTLYSKKIWNITNQINAIKFAKKYLNEKIKTLKTICEIDTNYQLDKNKEENQSAGIKEETRKTIQNYCIINREDNQYMVKYLDELNDTFHFNDPTTRKKTFGAVCLILFEKNKNNTKIFKGAQNFTHLAKLLSAYWDFPLPTDIRKNKYKGEAKKLKEKHIILERLLF